jgi:hypothetical protein
VRFQPSVDHWQILGSAISARPTPPRLSSGAAGRRADYCGKPNYTMCLPTAEMLTDLAAERAT